MFRHVAGRGTKVNQDSEASSEDESFGQLNSPEVEDESDIGESDEDDDEDVEEKPAKASKGSASKPTKIKNEPENVHKAIPLLLVQLHINIHLQFNPILMLGPAEDKLLAPPSSVIRVALKKGPKDPSEQQSMDRRLEGYEDHVTATQEFLEGISSLSEKDCLNIRT